MALHPASNIIYLETYIESTASLPPELQRILNTIKALDEKCIALESSIKDNWTTLCQLPPQHMHKDSQPQYQDLSQKVSNEQKMLLQFADEKVQLAHQAHDLLEMHALELERTLEQFEGELRASGQLEDTGDLDFALDTGRGKGPRQSAFDFNFDSLGDMDIRIPTVPVIPVKKQSTGLGATTVIHKTTKRPREDDGAGPSGFPPMKKKAPSVAPNFDDFGAADFGNGFTASQEFGGADPVEPLQTFRRPPPAGFQPSNHTLQAEGRLLTDNDVGPGLVGQHAELFWPDDNLWYLIEIQDVDVGQRTARVLYTTGEVETLSLAETIAERHMSLIPPQYYQ